jgi:cyclopropane fatty-acyl-phospholipid synthase-like methyltransferase
MFTQARNRVVNEYWERRLRISTRGIVPIDHADSVFYATMNYSAIWRVLDHLDLGPSDVFVDIGCGKGRVLCCAARYPVAQVMGVDLSAPLTEEARENARRLRGRRAPVTVHASDATAFDYSQATALFLFNPFGADTMSLVLDKISGQAHEGLRIAYAQPTHDDVFERQSWLERTAHWEASEGTSSVSFYRLR